MSLEVTGDLRALLQDVRNQAPDRLAVRLNQAWADEASQRLREYVGGGPMTTYLTARSGQARDNVRAAFSATGASVTASGPGMALQESGGTILPRNGQYLTFRLHQPWDGREPTGEWIRTRKVTIPARHMVRDAGNQALELMPDFLERLLEA